MQKINGDANALAVKVAAESGVDRFVYISSIQSTLPSFVLKGSVSASLKFNRSHHSNQMTFFSNAYYNWFSKILPLCYISYFEGKRKAEEAVCSEFKEKGVVLRPGFIYGTRAIPLPDFLRTVVGPTLSLPLGIFGRSALPSWLFLERLNDRIYTESPSTIHSVLNLQSAITAILGSWLQFESWYGGIRYLSSILVLELYIAHYILLVNDRPMEAIFGLPGMDMVRSLPGMGTILAQPLSGD